MASKWFKQALVVAAIATAFCLVPSETTQAQMGGYQWGTGFGFGQVNALRFTTPREDLPYFAKYPPVYYGDLVRRPYGFSPYAMPPGIMPAEYSAPVSRPCAQTIVNPYVPQQVEPVPTPPAPPAQPAPVEPSAESENISA